jgi:ABC-2 type transport system ATP-binding protein
VACIEARRLRKSYGATLALDAIDLDIAEGRIVGLIGPNGAGKSTALNAMVGLTSYQGQLRVLGRDPWTEREHLVRDASFITDVAILPRWLRVSQALDFAAGTHPRFDRAKAEAFLATTSITSARTVRELSKGMVTQLHLAIVMAIDARLLVLDEPTLGLDLIYRKQFYDALLTDCFEAGRTVILATHQVEEVQHVLTDVLYIDHGRIVFNRTMDDIEAQFHEVLVHPDRLAAARTLTPIAERRGVGHSVLIFEGRDRQQLAGFGEVRTPSVADLFLAVVK